VILLESRHLLLGLRLLPVVTLVLVAKQARVVLLSPLAIPIPFREDHARLLHSNLLLGSVHNK
jgi:hypothetical protein